MAPWQRARRMQSCCTELRNDIATQCPIYLADLGFAEHILNALLLSDRSPSIRQLRSFLYQASLSHQ